MHIYTGWHAREILNDIDYYNSYHNITAYNGCTITRDSNQFPEAQPYIARRCLIYIAILSPATRCLVFVLIV